MRSLILALCGLMLQLCANATTIVALWTPDRILMAADSRAIIGTSSSVDTCKIGHSGPTWFAVAGLITDTASGYALGDSLKQALATSAGLTDKVDRLITTVQPKLTTAVAGIENDSPEQFAEFATGRPILQAVLAETANGRPVMATVAFALDGAGAVQPRATLIDGSDARGPRLIYAGQQERIRSWLRVHRDWIDGDYAALVRDLVQLEVDANSPWVGGPVDLVEITAAGVGPHWLEGKSACRE